MRDVKTKFPRGKVVRERYIVEELLGQGGFGAVYRVRDRRVKGNVFALKEVADPNKQQHANFLFEGEVLRRLDHAALPRVYRVFEDGKNSRLYMLMDYIAGTNLERLRQQDPNKRLSLAHTLKVMAPIKQALHYLHEQKPPIIHRDLKPSNIIASHETAVLVDFGIAKEYDTDSTTTAIRHCSPGYGAPEQYVQGTTTQTDIYGFAATLYALLTGEVPIDALYRITRMTSKGVDPLIPPHEVVEIIPRGISDAIVRGMAVSSSDRFATIDDFWEELQVHADKSLNEEDLAAIAAALTLRQPPDTGAPVEHAVPETPLITQNAEEPETKSLVEPASAETSAQRRRNPLLMALGLLLFVVVVSSITITIASRIWPLEAANNSVDLTQTVLVQVTVTATATPVLTVTATPIPTSTATTLPTEEPTQQLPSYPQLFASYNGMANNTPANVSDWMTLSNVKRNGNQVTGYLSLGPQFRGNGPFSGTVTENNEISFFVDTTDAVSPLVFTGTIYSDGHMEGTYCSVNPDKQCDSGFGGNGSWSVTPDGTASSQPDQIPDHMLFVGRRKV